MKMSVFRQQAEMVQFEHTACIGAATTEADVDLILLSLNIEKPALVGLDGQSSIVKPYVAGDETLSFEALYDDAITSSDLAKMKERRVSSPADMPLEKFRVDLAVTIEGLVDVSLMIAAANNGDVRARLRKLNEHDELFREALYEAAMREFRRSNGEVIYHIRETTGLSEAADPDQLYDFDNPDG